MTETTATTKSKMTIGFDIGDRKSVLCVLDGEGAVIERGEVATSKEAIAHRFSGAPAVVALETGTHSPESRDDGITESYCNRSGTT